MNNEFKVVEKKDMVCPFCGTQVRVEEGKRAGEPLPVIYCFHFVKLVDGGASFNGFVVGEMVR